MLLKCLNKVHKNILKVEWLGSTSGWKIKYCVLTENEHFKYNIHSISMKELRNTTINNMYVCIS